MLTDKDRIDIVRYRIENAQNTLNEIESHIQNGFFNTAANRMYYACYYAASALLIINGITTKSHDGVRQMFSLHFVKTGILPMHLSRIYAVLFKQRTSGNYDDMFDNSLESVTELYPQAKEFVSTIKENVDTWLAENAQSE